MNTNKNHTNCIYCGADQAPVCEKCENSLLSSLPKFSKGEFAITHDHLDENIVNDLATVNHLIELGYTVPFKLYDDDDELYYSGRLHEDCEDEFVALNWGMYDSGCTYCTIRNPKTGQYEHL